MVVVRTGVYLQGQGLGEFHDIDQLTMFADYRVPVTLKELGILKYVKDLEAKVGRWREWKYPILQSSLSVFAGESESG